MQIDVVVDVGASSRHTCENSDTWADGGFLLRNVISFKCLSYCHSGCPSCRTSFARLRYPKMNVRDAADDIVSLKEITRTRGEQMCVCHAGRVKGWKSVRSGMSRSVFEWDRSAPERRSGAFKTTRLTNSAKIKRKPEYDSGFWFRLNIMQDRTGLDINTGSTRSLLISTFGRHQSEFRGTCSVVDMVWWSAWLYSLNLETRRHH